MNGGDAANAASARRAGNPVAAPRPAAADFQEYSFLLGHGLARDTLARACALAARSGTQPHEVLIAQGWLGEDAYHKALAGACGAPFVEAGATESLAPARPEGGPRACLQSGLLRQRRKGHGGLVLTPGHARPAELGKLFAQGRVDARPAAIASPAALRETVLRSFGRQILHMAIHGLAYRYRDESANSGLSAGQRRGLATLAALTIVSGTLFPLETLRVAGGLATLFFALVVCLRLVACLNLAFTLPLRLLGRYAARLPDAELPVYTVLVPLFREANMVRGLAGALARLDYPALGSKRTS